MTADSSFSRFEDAVVLVTGSTRGIGRGIVKRFAQEGAAVVVSGRTVDDGERIVRDLEAAGQTAFFIRADLRKAADIEQLIETVVEEHSRIDVLVNNAGVETDTSVTEATLDDWTRVVETDFRAFWLCAREAAKHIPAGGSIINVSSNHAFLTMPGKFPYNAVKSGIDGMTRAMALDLGPEIRVNTIDPGWIAIERTVGDMDEEYREYLEGIHPVGRVGKPADVAGTAAFLASEDAGFVTGASLLVDGGRAAVMQDDQLPDYTERAGEGEHET